MDFHNKKFKRAISVVVLVVIAAMVLTSVLPYVI